MLNGSQICRLCASDAPLRDSHIFPKFYWEWLKETGGEYFRSPDRPNQRMQDGFKEKLLCGHCEQRFSAVEKPFAERVFRPIMANPQARIQYESYAVHFLVSLLWRNLVFDIDDGHLVDHFKPQLLRAEPEWRAFLLEQGALSEFNRFHLFITDFPLPRSPQYNIYLTRVADYSIAWAGTSACALYLKFGKFVVWAEITSYNPANWINTLLSNDSGVLESAGQEIRDRGFGDFLLERAQLYDSLQERSRAETSPRQKDRIDAYFEKNAERLARSELMEAMLRDTYGAPLASLTRVRQKVRRNDACPCGSQKKYKRCHGA